MSQLQFSIGILSWKGYDSLKNSLISYEKNGLSKLTNNKFICLPEYNEEGIKIAKKFNYEPILIRKNIGILEYLPEELYIKVKAGTSLLDILEVLKLKNQTLGFEPVDLGYLYSGKTNYGSVAGAVSCNLSGPRRFKSGAFGTKLWAKIKLELATVSANASEYSNIFFIF